MEDLKKVYISTFGCQMNERDSENMMGLLAKHQFVQTSIPEDADLILINTCSIREHASEKAASQLGRFAPLKKAAGKQPVIGVTGCVAQQEGAAFLKRFPYVDLVLGTDAIPRLPEMVERLMTQNPRPLVKPRLLDVKRDLEAPVFVHEYMSYPSARFEGDSTQRRAGAYVVITKGCDFRCTFCVVPNTRGPERSASPEEILAETQNFARLGAREVTFLGQNVNSYGKNFSPAYSFPQLLKLIEEKIPRDSALQRLRFTTSHPVDLSQELMEAFIELPRLCHHLHLPVQSGDDQVLRRMKRLYTIEEYRNKIARLRSLVPDISLSTDIIVGFPGETEMQFARTLALLEEVRYTCIYAFKYSERPHTPACRLKDDVAEEVKDERLKRVLDFQRRLTREQNERLVGKRLKILVERRNERGKGVNGFTGRSECYRLVHFEAPKEEVDLIGKFVDTVITSGSNNSLGGTMVPETIN